MRDALAKALRLRELTSEKCEVTQINSNVPIPWDTDISQIHAEEVIVRVIEDKFSIKRKHLAHQFQRKTFLSLAFCECCRRLLFSGYYCHQCNIRFHPRCANKVETFCQQINIDSINPHHHSKSGLLDFHPQSTSVVSSTHTSGRRPPPRTLNQHDRSTSEPNVFFIIKPLTNDQKNLIQTQIRGPIQPDILFNTQNNSEHSHSTQASPTNTLKHQKRQRARSADESNKNLLSPRDPKSTDENWVSEKFILLLPLRRSTINYFEPNKIDVILKNAFM